MERSSEQIRQSNPPLREEDRARTQEEAETGVSLEGVAGPEETTHQLVERAPFDGGDEEAVFLASRGRRLAAQLLDGVALGAAIGLGAINGPAMAVGLVMLLIILQTYLLSAQGQTVGKSLMKIKIVREEDESNPGFGHAVMLRTVLPVLLSFIPFFSLIDILFIFRDDQRCIHDHMAGTKVIEDPDA